MSRARRTTTPRAPDHRAATRRWPKLLVVLAAVLLVPLAVLIGSVMSPDAPREPTPSSTPTVDTATTDLVGPALPRIIADVLGVPTAPAGVDFADTETQITLDLDGATLRCLLVPAGGETRWIDRDRPSVAAAFDCASDGPLTSEESVDYTFSSAIVGGLIGLEGSATASDERVGTARVITMDGGVAGRLVVVLRIEGSSITGAAAVLP